MAVATGTAILGAGALGALASTIGSSQQSSATGQAAQLQNEAANQQLALQKRIYEEGVARQDPWLKAGVNALAQMQAGAAAQPAAFKFGAGDYQADPGYAFRLAEGQKALERSAAARGGLLSGGTGKALTRYGQEMGSQEFQNAYNRALTGYNANVARSDTNYNRLASMAGLGQTATQQLGAAGQNYASSVGNISGQAASNIGNMMTSGAAARASGYVGGANALSQSLGSYLNYNQNQDLLDRLAPLQQSNAFVGPTYGSQPLGSDFDKYLIPGN